MAELGVIGLGVMGRNLVLNLLDRGFQVAVYNRTGEKTREFMEGEGRGRAVVPAASFPGLGCKHSWICGRRARKKYPSTRRGAGDRRRRRRSWRPKDGSGGLNEGLGYLYADPAGNACI